MQKIIQGEDLPPKNSSIGWRYPLLTAPGVTTIFICQPSEPVYEGRKLSAWAKDLFFIEGRANDPRTPAVRQKHEQAVSAIQHMATEALPWALKLCRAQDSWFAQMREHRQEQWNEQHQNFEAHVVSAMDEQLAGGNIIWALGSGAKPAIPELIKMLKGRDREIAGSAMYALQGVGTNAIPPLLEMLHSNKPQWQIRAAGVLGRFGPQASNAVPVLLHCLEGEDEGVRLMAVRALGLIHTDGTAVVPALLHHLEQETNHPLSLDYIWALGHFGTNARPAVPILIKIIESDRIFSPSAIAALRKIDSEAAAPFLTR